MVKLKKLIVVKIAAIFLSFLMLQINFPVYAQKENIKTNSEDVIYKTQKLQVIKGANVRLKPDKESSAIATVNAGTILESTDKVGSWYKVIISKKEDGKILQGYIWENLVKVIGEEAKVREEPEVVKVTEKKSEPEKKIIEKAVKKKKKKFPVLLVVAGVAAVVVAILLLTKKKKETSNDNPNRNYDISVLGIEWIDISAGEFQMGDNFNEGWSDERPVHTVYLDSYKVSRYEVTFDQYDRFCDDTGWSKPDDQGWGRGNRPVINVSWNDADAFCDWLSQKTGKNIHLPTEAQWEKAARGTDQRRYPWGNSSPNSTRCNYNTYEGRTQPVGSYPSGVSPYGVHDMAGNVFEWCSDWYSSDYYSSSPRNNPTGPLSGTLRVLRGGSWYYPPRYLRSAARYYNGPSYTYFHIGFRLAQE
jgi:formylglycine-generating enzyme required for sulfatase activity